eukprot:TRINITY_DN795_c0_g1_i4.p1 TRINITY_DN795_c0_g1~~TRINITY_DN795_c0_g1_i4.p1  ORF type:complete len:269 (-),score=80.38 TRINITY_DN795_c0_g1_i4:704-1510(-)
MAANVPSIITQVPQSGDYSGYDDDIDEFNGGISARGAGEEEYYEDEYEDTPQKKSIMSKIFCCFGSDTNQNNMVYPNNNNEEALLPEPLPEHKGKKCLVLDLDETLVHSSFKRIDDADFAIPVVIDDQSHDVYVLKRPNVDEFMRKMGEMFEIVVFTASLAIYADPVLDLLDIHKVVTYRLFREHCCNNRGNYVKDLSKLGRKLKDTLIIDNSKTSFMFQPENAILIGGWYNDQNDTELNDLTPLLTKIAECDDVRPLLRDYKAEFNM